MITTMKWQEQYQRMYRWFERLKETKNGRLHDRDSRYYEDEILAFFMNCYHLKDWIKNDNIVDKQIRDKVDDHINKDKNLQICADLCNSIKHLNLNRPPRSGQIPEFGTKKIRISLGSEPTRIGFDWFIELNGSVIDAFELAEACIQSWNDFLSLQGLTL
ncbi:MAG: hypothetical protein EPO32_10130 [Anaerolineae bacterium]|nr:MAG: hypothetical protein EPO32_10130 [Anaerolineae bacterium]